MGLKIKNNKCIILLLMALVILINSCDYNSKEIEGEEKTQYFIRNESINKSNLDLSNLDYLCKDCNVIIIGLTNVRKDHMGLYNYSLDTTPNIDNFAKKSIVFENAFSPSSWTLPTMTSILTSLYPLKHNVAVRFVLDKNHTIFSYLDENVTTIMDILRKNNYITATFNGGFDFLPRHGVTSRFDENYYPGYDSNRGIRADTNIAIYGSFNYSVPAAINWISNNKNKKFFAYVQGFDAHCPFEIPRKNDKFIGSLKSKITFDKCYWTFKKEKEMTIAGKKYYYLQTEATFSNESDSFGPNGKLLSEEDINYMIALYDGEINLVDNYVGTLLDHLESENILDNTIVIIFSEHGDMFGKHGRFMRGGPLRGTFYDDVLNVPLMIYHPRIDATNVYREELVELIDLSPTILEMLSINTPDEFYGKSFVPVILNDTPIRDNIFAASYFTPEKRNFFFNSSTLIGTIRTNEWKLINEILLNDSFFHNGVIAADINDILDYSVENHYELYNINIDPQELIDVKEQNPEILNQLINKLYKKFEEVS